MAQTINNAGNNTVGASNTGQTNTFTVTNPSNTASSAALVNVTVGGGTADDAFTTYTVSGVTNWSQGIDNSASDAFVVAASTALGTTNCISLPAAATGGTFTGDQNHTFTTRNTASFIELDVTNTDTATSGSNTAIFANNGGTGSGAVYFGLNKGSARSWSIGMPLTTSTNLAITTTNSANVSPNTGTAVWNMTAAGERTISLQPAFLAYLGASISNVSGNGTTFTLGTTTALTEVYDQGSNFVTSGTFTAPVTGRYSFSGCAYLNGCTIASGIGMIFTTSNATYQNNNFRAASSLDIAINYTANADMDAADTCVCTIVTTGEAGVTDDLLGSSVRVTWFSGYLEC